MAIPLIVDDTQYFYTWFRNDKCIDYSNYRNGTLRLPMHEKASGVYRCRINANSTALLSESITVEYPGTGRDHKILLRFPAQA